MSVRKEITWQVTENGCHECTSHRPNGQGYPGIERGGCRSTVSRMVYITKHGPLPAGVVVRHTCDNSMCINPDHLIPGTQLQNIADRVARNRSASGESNGQAKLNRVQVEVIRFTKMPAEVVADVYGVHPDHVRKIRRGEKW